MMMNYFAVWLTKERRLALFPAGTIVRNPHHCKSLISHEQDLNLLRTWVQDLLNGAVPVGILGIFKDQWTGNFPSLGKILVVLDCVHKLSLYLGILLIFSKLCSSKCGGYSLISKLIYEVPHISFKNNNFNKMFVNIWFGVTILLCDLVT